MSNPNSPESQVITKAIAIANACVLDDVRSEAWAIEIDGTRWWDTRPMVDHREHAAESVDRMRLALDYALSVGLIQMHPQLPHLVRIVCG